MRWGGILERIGSIGMKKCGHISDVLRCIWIPQKDTILYNFCNVAGEVTMRHILENLHNEISSLPVRFGDLYMLMTGVVNA